jgi:hypothetical protein
MAHRRSFLRAASPLLAAALVSLAAGEAAAVDADPATYEAVLPTLQPGDTLVLAPGMYTGNLDITGLNGTPEAPITITGPDDKSAVFVGQGCCNTVEITGSSHVVVKNLTVDGQGLGGVFGVSAKDGESNVVHHITIEGCLFVGHGASQQTVAISTKAPTWGWIIRGNVIDGAGTGLYLGNSDGTSPFVSGLIEGNLVKDTIGYNMQIKFHGPWPAGTGLPAETTTTIVRNNVFLKNDAPSPDGDRPNVLVGGFPESGPGSDNLYEIYGNFFFHNPREAHLQVSGRATIHDNVFVDAIDAAVVLTDHDLPLRMGHVYNNTIYGVARGVRFGNAASEGDLVAGNLIFAPEGVTGPVETQADNLVAAMAEANTIVAAPSLTLGQMDFYPLPGQAQGAPIDLSSAAGETDFDIDFNGNSKGDFAFRGAYAGEGQNPGWPLDDGIKEGGGMGAGGGGVGGGGAGAGAGAGSGAGGASSGAAAGGAGGVGNGAEGGDDSGCGCVVGGRSSMNDPRIAALLLAVAACFARRGRR